MSLYSDPEENGGQLLSTVERYVARGHWEPVATQALLQGTIMACLTVLLGMPLSSALPIIHLVTLVTATIHGVLAQRLEESGEEEAAVVVARRSLAALMLSGTALVLMPLAG